MRRHALAALAAFALPLLAAGCNSATPPSTVGNKPLLKPKIVKKKESSPATTEQEAILRILDGSAEQLKAQYDPLPVDAKPSAVAKAFAAYVEGAEKLDVAGTPIEFRGAWNRYLKAWRGVVGATKGLADIYEDVEFMELLQALFRGNAEKANKLGGDMAAAVRKVNVTHSELHSSAEAYGVDIRDVPR